MEELGPSDWLYLGLRAMTTRQAAGTYIGSRAVSQRFLHTDVQVVVGLLRSQVLKQMQRTVHDVTLFTAG